MASPWSPCADTLPLECSDKALDEGLFHALSFLHAREGDLSLVAMTVSSHFRVSKKAQDSLGITVLNVLQHCVVIRTERGPRFMSRKVFDSWEAKQRAHKARGCHARYIANNVWMVLDPTTNTDAHTVIRTGAYAKGIEGKWSCTCTDAHFMMERGQEPCCKHILAAHMQLTMGS